MTFCHKTGNKRCFYSFLRYFDMKYKIILFLNFFLKKIFKVTKILLVHANKTMIYLKKIYKTKDNY